MESAERELEETRGRAEALDRALAATRSAHEQREREVEVAIKDFKYVHSRLSPLSLLHMYCTVRHSL